MRSIDRLCLGFSKFELMHTKKDNGVNVGLERLERLQCEYTVFKYLKLYTIIIITIIIIVIILLFALCSIYSTDASGHEQMPETNNSKLNKVKNPNWPEAKQLAIYKHG